MVEDWALALVGSPWVFLALYLAITIDGFFPPLPSESVVIALAVLAVADGEPNLLLLGVVAALGAFTGDQVAYTLGRRAPVDRMPFMQGPQARRGRVWAERALAERGASFIIAARYIPVGRVAVNMTAGTVRFSRLRFTALAGIAAVSWSVYSLALGVGAGVWLGENKLLAVAAGVAIGLTLGVVIDAAMKLAVRRRRGRRGVIVADDQTDLPAPAPARDLA